MKVILERVYNCNKYRRKSKTTTDKRIVNIDSQQMGCTSCTCFFGKR